jgi:thiosulfate/3-mercaptopyruvate sulfurtransferase
MTTTKALLTTLALTFPTLALAEEPGAKKLPPLLSHEALQKRLGDPRLRILDARPRAEYETGHIPGAVWVDGQALGAASKPESLEDKEAWSKVLAPLGIGPDTEVFLYDDARQHDSAKAWWLLSYAGARVGLIDGGFKLWERDRRPVASEPTSLAAGTFAIHFHPKQVASRADVHAALKSGDARLLDARSAAEYRGESPAGAQAKPGRRPGHIPTARSFEAYELVDADGRFLAPEVQLDRLARAGFAQGKPVIAYSAGGARSALVVFALHRLGIPARHYHAGLGDWLKDASAPIVTGDQPGEAPADRSRASTDPARGAAKR